MSSESLKKHEFAAKPLSLVDIRQKMVGWIKDQVPLWEAFWIATAIHVLLIPVLWIMGWVLPWPKPPVITTVVEIDLRNWPREAKPLSVEEIRLPEHNR